jgi:hypothetical protein
MNPKFEKWLKQQCYSILGKWDGCDGYRTTFTLYTTKKRINEENNDKNVIIKWKWAAILHKNLLSGWN